MTALEPTSSQARIRSVQVLKLNNVRLTLIIVHLNFLESNLQTMQLLHVHCPYNIRKKYDYIKVDSLWWE